MPGAAAPSAPPEPEARDPLSAPADPLAPVRGDLLWWLLLGGGVFGLAVLLRPLARRRTARRVLV